MSVIWKLPLDWSCFVSQRDYYEVLSLSRSATPDQIKRSYRRLAKKFHPDHYKGKDPSEGAAKFNEVQEAYSILSDPQKRKLYNQFGHRGLEGGGPSVAQRVWRTGPADFNVSDFADSVGGFENIFQQFFRRGGNRRRSAARPARGQDIVKKISLPFLKAALGTKSIIKLRSVDRRGASKLQTLEVKIPPGVDDGSRIRIRGKGRASPSGGPQGDLYLEVSVESHAYFWRQDRDIYLDLPLTFSEAALGTSVDVPTLEGTTALKVPPGVSSGQKLRLRDKGIPPATASGRPGHQYVVIKIVSPPKVNSKAKQALKDFEQACDYKLDRFK